MGIPRDSKDEARVKMKMIPSLSACWENWSGPAGDSSPCKLYMSSSQTTMCALCADMIPSNNTENDQKERCRWCVAETVWATGNQLREKLMTQLWDPPRTQPMRPRVRGAILRKHVRGVYLSGVVSRTSDVSLWRATRTTQNPSRWGNPWPRYAL